MDNNDSNAGNSDPGYNPSADAGNQGDQNDQGSGGQGNSGNQNGQQTDPRDAELSRMRTEIKNLNRAIVEARRGGNNPQLRSPSGKGNQGADDQSFSTPEERYAASIQIATNELRGAIEDIFSLYPEVPQGELSRIRKNPWSFASLRSYQSGDFETAKKEIELYLFERADELSKSDPKQNIPGGDKKVPPAVVPLNPPAAPVNPADPGTSEDQDPWTMPIDKLEKQVAKEKLKMKNKS